MDVSNGSTANGAKIIQWPSTGGTNQKWTLTRVHIYTLKSVKSGLWRRARGGTNQQRALDLTGSYTGSNYLLVNIGSGLNIGVAGSTTQGAPVDQELGGSSIAKS